MFDIRSNFLFLAKKGNSTDQGKILHDRAHIRVIDKCQISHWSEELVYELIKFHIWSNVRFLVMQKHVAPIKNKCGGEVHAMGAVLGKTASMTNESASVACSNVWLWIFFKSNSELHFKVLYYTCY